MSSYVLRMSHPPPFPFVTSDIPQGIRRSMARHLSKVICQTLLNCSNNVLTIGLTYLPLLATTTLIPTLGLVTRLWNPRGLMMEWEVWTRPRS